MFSQPRGRACRRCYSSASAFLPAQSHRCPVLTASRKVAYAIHRADLAPVLAAIVADSRLTNPVALNLADGQPARSQAKSRLRTGPNQRREVHWQLISPLTDAAHETHLKLPGRRSSCLFEGPRVQDLSAFFDRVS